MLKFEIDADAIAAQFKQFAKEVKDNIEKSMENLATLTRANIVEQTDKDLNTARSVYTDALGDVEEVAPGVWVISLDEKALWIEEGIEPNHDMKPDLLKGKKYRVIPFKYNRPPTQNSNLTNALVGQIKQTLKKEGLSMHKIEYNANGSPRVGKLHEYDINKPISIRPGKGNTEALTRLSVYQTEDAKTNKIKRDVLTFRTVSSGPASAGKWIHPGYTGKKYMDKAMEKAAKMWEEQILPEIMERWKE